MAKAEAFCSRPDYRYGSRIGTLFREHSHSPTWAVDGNMNSACPSGWSQIEKKWEFCFYNNNFHEGITILLHAYGFQRVRFPDTKFYGITFVMGALACLLQGRTSDIFFKTAFLWFRK